jgi:YbgC/YbaW family acyl-CoA thioester hydrolase
MPYEFKVIRRVEFSDTDMAGLMHYSNFFRFMETAEHAFFRSLGTSIFNAEDPSLGRPRVHAQWVGWPRVHAECDFKAPLRFEDEVEIHLLVAAKKSKALHYTFIFRKLNASPPVEVARGALTVVCVRHKQGGAMSACPIPKSVANQIQTAPPELLV